ncbi:LPS export ABC transporter periplasmic protein LptC [Treponema primitia]|uniref:LPS export ABC transporter periplasmic protein LptC n=1 Tax=Treponema primitia TaxID=88058 RepID=UPI00025556F6|nr:LPS export ABC transporter periplasmic protein LptC [Treponema primitia]
MKNSHRGKDTEGRKRKGGEPQTRFSVFSSYLYTLCGYSFCILLLLASCTFDYGDEVSENEDLPDIVMGNVEYVRVRDGDPVVRFRAQLAERYENRQTMELQNFSFEQFYSHGDEVNATGRAGSALVELESGNIQLENSIIISVNSEDITIETENLSWEDEKRILAGRNEDTVVDIQRSDGTVFSGRGFTADVRRRTWVFNGGVEGIYIDTEDDEETEVEAEEISEELEGEVPAELMEEGSDTAGEIL